MKKIIEIDKINNTRDSDSASVLNNLAWVYSELGDDKALKIAKEAHALQPNDPAINDTVGWILVKEKKI